MSDNEDLELQALQRQLDDAFETTRPRAAFEDELWSRMQARRPLGVRVQDFFAGLVDSVREAPRVPATAVAVVLVLAIGVGIVSLSGFHLGGGAGSTASLATRDSAGGPQYNATAGTFGALPAPALESAQPAPSGPKTATQDFAGPAKLVWAGQLKVHVTSAPVFRFQEPTKLDADRFATALGASPQTGQKPPGALGEYAGDGFGLIIAGSSIAPLREPSFIIAQDRSRLPSFGPSPTDTANAYLSAHSLVPTWPYVVAVEQSGDFTQVIYQRQFSIPAAGLVYLVDATGQRHGITVEIKNGQWLQADGPLPLNLDSADYRIISADQAVRSAQSSSSTGAAIPPDEPLPTVRLTNAELVYALANAGDHSFYEPAYLFSGTFTRNGVTYVKRVLVPAVDPSQRSS